MNIRRLVTEDASDFARIRLQGLLESPRAFGSSPDEDKAVEARAVAKKIQTEPDSPLFGILDPALVAVAGLHRNSHRKARHRATIWGVYVLPDRRGEGLGTELLRHIVETARGIEGLERLDLCVVVDNRQALQLYENLGFKVWGHEIEAMIVGSDYMDEYHLSLRLKTR
jgi:RimJ/RimL family protein N-acetyltransferase